MTNTSRTFRVFISSTFSDLKAERDALQCYVFPRLRDLCLRENCRFQPIDLRWGVREEAARDQKTMSICLNEIARCQQVSPRPNFLILLGDRYGWRPLPWQVPAEEMEALQPHIASGDRSLLERWYRRDDNAVPPVYLLQRRTVDFVENGSGDAVHAAQEAEARVWQQIEQELRRIFLYALKQERFSHAQAEKYLASATEQEITRGALQVDDAADHVFAFLRTIIDGPTTFEGAAQDFFDVVERDGVPVIDDDAHDRLTMLKEDTLPGRLPNNVVRYTARWTKDGLSRDHIGTLPESLDECLALTRHAAPPATLCVDAWIRLSSIILAEIKTLQAMDPLDVEIAAHRAFGNDRRRSFVGRKVILESVDEYLRSDARTPLALVGPSGSGKSALLAEIAERARGIFPPEAVTVRFVGATPDSSNIRSFLDGLTQEILRRIGEAAAPSDPSFREIVRAFANLLDRASAREALIIVIDALDQFSDAENARRLLWLPMFLSERVKVIVSAVPGECASILERTLPAEAYLKVEPMSVDEGGQMLDSWLRASGRKLNPSQRDTVLHLFEQEGRPLFLRLVFEHARQWPFYLDAGSLMLSKDIRGLLGAYFESLSDDSNHGSMLVSRSLGYLAAARNGLSEDELLDVLSRDAAVFHDFTSRTRHEPPEQRLPVVVWSRLYFDLEPYLVTRRADDAALLTFYHRQFEEEATERYLSGDDGTARHRELARYFECQPTHLDAGSRRTPNLRRLSELPYQQTQAGLWRDLRGTLADFDFLQAKVESGLAGKALEDFENLRRSLPLDPGYNDPIEEERKILTSFSGAFNQEYHSFCGSPEITSQQIYSNLFAQNNPEGPVEIALRSFLERDRYPRGHSWFRRLNRAPLTATSRLLRRTIVAHDAPVMAVAVSPSGDFIATGATDGTLNVWKESDGTQQASMQAHVGGVAAVCWVPGSGEAPDLLVSAGRDGGITVWDWSTERQVVSWRAHAAPVRGLTVASSAMFLLSCGDDHLVKAWHWSTGQEIFTLRGHKDRVFCVAADAAGGLIVSGGEDRTLRVRTNAPAALPLTLRGHESAVHCVALELGGLRAVSGSEDGCLKTWDLHSGREFRSIAAHRRRITAVAIAPGGEPRLRHQVGGHQIASAGEDGVIRLWDAATVELVRAYRGHASGVRAVVFAPNRRWLASTGDDGTLRIWSLEEERQREESSWEHDGSIFCMHYLAHAGNVATGGADNVIRIWNDKDGAPCQVLRGHFGPVLAVIASPADDILISAGGDRTIKVWQRSTGVLLRTLGSQIAAAVASGLLQAKDVAAAALPTKGHAGPVTCLAYIHGEEVLSGSKDGTLRLWNFRTGSEVQVFKDVRGPVESIIVKPSGEIVASAGAQPEIALWNIRSGRMQALWTGHTANVTCLALFPDESRLVSGSLDRTIRVWDMSCGSSKVLEGHTDRINAVVTWPNKVLIASAGHDATVRVWNIEDGAALHVLHGHSAPVRCLAVDAALGHLLSGGDDGYLNVWEADSGERVARMYLGAPVLGLIALPDGCVCAGLKNGGVAFLTLRLADKKNHGMEEK